MGADAMSSVRTWSVGVLTAPRPTPTLPRMLASLCEAGWSDLLVVEDRRKLGHFFAWMKGLATIVDREPHADAYFLIEDDAVFCRRLRAYLEQSLWPEDPRRLALCSPYSPEAYRAPQRGWHTENRGLYLASSLAWVLPPAAARAVLADLGPWHAQGFNADRLVGQWAADRGLDVFYHTPSLAQHVGVGNSALGDPVDSPLRHAADFVGEEGSPWA